MQKYFDLIGISLSGICFIHCVLTPVLIMISPFLAGHEFHENIIYILGCNVLYSVVLLYSGVVYRVYYYILL